MSVIFGYLSDAPGASVRHIQRTHVGAHGNFFMSVIIMMMMKKKMIIYIIIINNNK